MISYGDIWPYRYCTITILTVWGHMTVKWQQGSVVVELDWPHSIACPPKPPIRCKDLGDIFYRSRIIAFLSQILLPWQQGSVRLKFCWQYSMAQPRKPPCRCKDLADISSRNRAVAHFVSNFVAMATTESPG